MRGGCYHQAEAVEGAQPRPTLTQPLVTSGSQRSKVRFVQKDSVAPALFAGGLTCVLGPGGNVPPPLFTALPSSLGKSTEVFRNCSGSQRVHSSSFVCTPKFACWSDRVCRAEGHCSKPALLEGHIASESTFVTLLLSEIYVGTVMTGYTRGIYVCLAHIYQHACSMPVLELLLLMKSSSCQCLAPDSS